MVAMILYVVLSILILTTLEPVMLMAHQDVVSADPATLACRIHPPFEGRIVGGFIWGRGTIEALPISPRESPASTSGSRWKRWAGWPSLMPNECRFGG
jgi:hypothetical protein